MSVFAAILLMCSSYVSAGHRCCPSCATPCVRYETVTKTIMVPTTVMEQRTIQCVRHVPQQRERTVTLKTLVPETKQVEYTCTVMVPKEETRTQTYTVAKPVWRTVEQQCTVMVPTRVQKTGYRVVCKKIPYTVMRTVCEDHGCWVVDRCGRRCWQPKIVKRQVPVTCYKTYTDTVPYKYYVTVCKPEIRTRTIRVCDYEREQRTREVTCTVYVPKRVTKTLNVVKCKEVPVEHKQRYIVMVPEKYEKTIHVPVCRMVPKTVTCKVPVYCYNS